MEFAEFEEKVIDALLESAISNESYVMDEIDFNLFLTKLRGIMPPTCGQEQRKLLNCIEKTRGSHTKNVKSGRSQLMTDLVEIIIWVTHEDMDYFDLEKVIKGE